MPDRFEEGYTSAQTYYQRKAAHTGVVTREWAQPTDPLGEKGRDAIRKAWPTLAGALDALTEETR